MQVSQKFLHFTFFAPQFWASIKVKELIYVQYIHHVITIQIIYSPSFDIKVGIY